MNSVRMVWTAQDERRQRGWRSRGGTRCGENPGSRQKVRLVPPLRPPTPRNSQPLQGASPERRNMCGPPQTTQQGFHLQVELLRPFPHRVHQQRTPWERAISRSGGGQGWCPDTPLFRGQHTCTRKHVPWVNAVFVLHFLECPSEQSPSGLSVSTGCRCLLPPGKAPAHPVSFPDFNPAATFQQLWDPTPCLSP